MDRFSSHKAFGHDLILWQMHFKMLFIIGCFLLSLYLCFFILSARIFLGVEGSSQVRTWISAKALSPLFPEHELSLLIKDKVLTGTTAEFAQSRKLQTMMIHNLWKLFFAALIPLPVFLIFPKILAHYQNKEQKRLQPKYIDGARLLSPSVYKEQIEAKYHDTYLPFGGWYDGQKYHSINLPTKVENTHIAVFGGIQSGKTTLLAQMIHALRLRGDIAIILDQKGDYTPCFYDSNKDHILNFLDRRCLNWNFWNDIEGENMLLRQAEIEAIGSGLIPDVKDNSNQFFHDAARDVFIGILSYLDSKKQFSYANLWTMINRPTKDIAVALADIHDRGHVFISEPGKQSQSVHSVLMQYGRVFKYAQVLDNNDLHKFSIRKWLEEGRGFIYLTNYDSIKDILRPMISMFVNFLSKKILTSKENRFGRRIWFFLDEFGSLHKIPTLVDILARGGSKGVCVVLATQDRGQIQEIYGADLTDTILNSCNSWAALRCVDPATARIIVDRVGEWRFERQEETILDRFDDGGDSLNIAKRIHREKLLLDNDIMRQEVLSAYIHVDGCDFTHAEIEKRHFESHCPAFIAHPDINLNSITHNSDPVDFADLDTEVGV